MSTSTSTEFVVLTASAKMPSSCWGNYGRVAVLEVERGTTPKMISPRARGVVRVVETWERLHSGKRAGRGGRCAFSRALLEAEELAARLNAGRAE